MEAFFGKWKTGHAFDENVDAFMEADSIPEEYREKMKEMDVNFSLEEVANEPGKYDWKIELGEVNLTRYNLTFQIKYHDFINYNCNEVQMFQAILIYTGTACARAVHIVHSKTRDIWRQPERRLESQG